MPVVWFVILAIIFQCIMSFTVYGKHTYAIGSNERAAALVGTPVNRYKVAAYMISGVTASIGGILLAARLGRGDAT